MLIKTMRMVELELPCMSTLGFLIYFSGLFLGVLFMDGAAQEYADFQFFILGLFCIISSPTQMCS